MSEKTDEKLTLCPNCERRAVLNGENEIVCEKCDTVFKLTKQQGAKVRKTGVLYEIEERLKKCETKLFPEDNEPDEPDEPDDSGEIFPR
jgi:uncharacterized C2H2 Zn-finger protein